MFKFMKSAFISSSDLDRPKFEVVKEHEGFEERLYEPSVWISTDRFKTMGLKQNNSDMFWSLFRYIQGANSDKQKIEMTAPVIRKVEPGAGPACENHIDMSFFVPPQFSEKPPEPTNKDLHISRMPAMRVYVRKFSGFAKDDDFMRAMQELAEMIPDKENVMEGVFFTAGYDSPWQMFKRTNEVWFLKKDTGAVEDGPAAGKEAQTAETSNSQGDGGQAGEGALSGGDASGQGVL